MSTGCENEVSLQGCYISHITLVGEKTQDPLERSHLQLAWEHLGFTQEKLKYVAGNRQVWADLHSLLPLQFLPGKMDGKGLDKKK